MALHLQLRDLPDVLHQQLCERAAARGLSLHQYAIEVFWEHCRRPTLDEWLDGLDRLPPVQLSTPAADALRQARDADGAID